jgi:hypothetical protein
VYEVTERRDTIGFGTEKLYLVVFSETVAAHLITKTFAKHLLPMVLFGKLFRRYVSEVNILLLLLGYYFLNSKL